MRWAYIGNFEPPHSTENEVRKAIEANGWTVDCHQENESWAGLIDQVAVYDVVLWTSTRSLRPPDAVQAAMLATAANADVPTVFYHLDRWWGLQRERELRSAQWTRCALVCTADGGHDDRWEALGVNHRWFPPAVSEFECRPGTPRDEYRSEIAFVGSWDGYGHREAWHRPALVDFLLDAYGDRVRFWPERGQPALRGGALRDLVASTALFVGDSCILSADEARDQGRYWSDRIPELTGRGGLLLHPWTYGIDSKHRWVPYWTMGDWDALRSLINEWLGSPDWRREAWKTHGRDDVLKHHTYTVRMRQLVDTLRDEGMLP
jgi:hypothetical protein